MDINFIDKILNDTAYERVCGGDGETSAAKYISDICREMGVSVETEEFSADGYEVEVARLEVGGKEYPCAAFWGCGSGSVTAPLLYLPNTDEVALAEVKGKILLLDSMGYWLYGDLIKQGAVGVVTYCGNVNFNDRDISLREIRKIPEGLSPILAVNIHATDAVEIAAMENPTAKITVNQKKRELTSRNVVAELKGEREETIVFSAHYDTTPLSLGAYDNMSGCIGLFGIMMHYLKNPCGYTLRFLWCGGEERGLLGSEAYCDSHRGEWDNWILNLNLDMIGSIMGKFTAFASCNETAKELFEQFSKKNQVPMEIVHGLRSSDSNIFADRGIPALSFARYAGGNTALIHTRYDTAEVISLKRLLDDTDVIVKFMAGITAEEKFPIPREIDQKIKEDLDKYFLRKR